MDYERSIINLCSKCVLTFHNVTLANARRGNGSPLGELEARKRARLSAGVACTGSSLGAAALLQLGVPNAVHQLLHLQQLRITAAGNHSSRACCSSTHDSNCERLCCWPRLLCNLLPCPQQQCWIQRPCRL